MQIQIFKSKTNSGILVWVQYSESENIFTYYFHTIYSSGTMEFFFCVSWWKILEISQRKVTYFVNILLLVDVSSINRKSLESEKLSLERVKDLKDAYIKSHMYRTMLNTMDHVIDEEIPEHQTKKKMCANFSNWCGKVALMIR